jgi:hypothetical protein
MYLLPSTECNQECADNFDGETFREDTNWQLDGKILVNCTLFKYILMYFGIVSAFRVLHLPSVPCAKKIQAYRILTEP